MDIKLGSTGAAQALNNPKKSKKASSSSEAFSSFLEETQESATPTVSTASSLAGINALLLAQSVDDALQDNGKKKKAIRQGHNLLDKLEDLRTDILLGKVSKAKLITLAQNLRETREKGLDEELDLILNEIELRAEVELAKLSNGI